MGVQSVKAQLANTWTPVRPPPKAIHPDLTRQRILASHAKAVQSLSENPIEGDPIQLPRVPEDEEKSLPPGLYLLLAETRKLGERLQIPSNRIWVHQDWKTNDNNILKGSPIWYHSLDVGHYASQTIPVAGNNGFPQASNFREPLIPGIIDEKRLPHITFDVDNWVKDIYQYSLDPNIMAAMLCGAPQSFMGPLVSFIHDNYPLDEDTYDQFWNRVQKESDAGRSKIIVGINKLKELFPFHRSVPLGSVPKNSKARRLLAMGLKAERRPIQDASAEDPNGCSINNCTSYEYMHRVTLPKIEEIIESILWLADRCYEFGFQSHWHRIKIWKRDVQGAYRFLLTHPTDQWLLFFSITDPSGKYRLFIQDLVSAFGYRKAVSVWCRFAYAISNFTAQPCWCSTHFPQLALAYEEGDEDLREAPPAESLNIDKFRRGASAIHGQCDPKIGFRRHDYIDDSIQMHLNVHDRCRFINSRCTATGVRNPCGKVESTKLRDWKVKECTKKMKDNGPYLMGIDRPDIFGIIMDVNNLMIELTQSYAAETIECVNAFMQNKSKPQSPKAWNSLAGKLSRVIIVYPCAMNLMREIWIVASVSERSQKPRRASNQVLSCLKSFVTLLNSNPGTDMRFDKGYRSTFFHGLDLSIGGHHAAHGLSDASTSVGVAINCVRSGKYWFRKWTWWEIKVARGKIFIFEAIGTFYLVRVMLAMHRNLRLVLWGDNMGLVNALNNAGSGDLVTNSILRLLSKDLAAQNIVLAGDKERLSFNHCNTVMMRPYADALTRNRETEFLNHMKQNHPEITPVRLLETNPIIKQATKDLYNLFLNFLPEQKRRVKNSRSIKSAKKSRR